jgi:hypothetical protein
MLCTITGSEARRPLLYFDDLRRETFVECSHLTLVVVGRKMNSGK